MSEYEKMKVIFRKKPRLRDPTMITGLPGMGLVAKQVVDYFVRGVKAELIGKIISPYLLPAVAPFNKGQIRDIEEGVYKFHSWKGRENDLLFFTGDYQPNSPENQHKLADRVIEVAENFGVRRLFTGAATPVGRYVEEPKVYGVAGNRQSIRMLREKGVTIMGDGAISGFNGIVLSYAKRRGMEAVCLLGETYLIESIDVKAALVIIKKLAEILDVEIDVAEIERAAGEFDRRFHVLLKHHRDQERRSLGYIY
ncbi:MAG: PAC2 family protein [Candidatus Geothermarchaeales archaeon]